jgi:predicted Rossmann fold nucleotide-binding protein DprA/Smf involved in DNA uptake
MLFPGNPAYPPGLGHAFGPQAPNLALLGEPALLTRATLGLFCSVRCPGALILRGFDLASEWREAGVTVAGGFHSPMEQECMRILLRGSAGVVWWLARGIGGARLSQEQRQAVHQGRLLLVAEAALRQRRATAETAARRNLQCAAACQRVLIIHAQPGGRTESLCRQAVAWGKQVYTLGDEANAHLLALGVEPWPF